MRAWGAPKHVEPISRRRSTLVLCIRRKTRLVQAYRRRSHVEEYTYDMFWPGSVSEIFEIRHPPSRRVGSLACPCNARYASGLLRIRAKTPSATLLNEPLPTQDGRRAESPADMIDKWETIASSNHAGRLKLLACKRLQNPSVARRERTCGSSRTRSKRLRGRATGQDETDAW